MRRRLCRGLQRFAVTLLEPFSTALRLSDRFIRCPNVLSTVAGAVPFPYRTGQPAACSRSALVRCRELVLFD